jgi:hypothetical protein
VESNWCQVRVKKAELEVQEPREAHCKWRKTTKACLHISCTNRELGDRLGVLGNGRQMAVWISLDENHEIVDFLEYTANLEASVVMWF